MDDIKKSAGTEVLSRRNVLKTAAGGTFISYLGTADGGSVVTATADSDTSTDSEFQSVLQATTGSLAADVVAAENQVYYTSGQDVTALNESGERLWRTSVPFTTDDDELTLTVAGPTILVYTDTSGISENIAAFDAETGEIKWRESFAERIWLVRSDGERAFVLQGANVNAYDVDSGDLLWRDTPGEFDFSSTAMLVSQSNTIVASTVEDGIVAYETASGERTWEVETDGERTLRTDGERVFTAPVPFSDTDGVTLRGIAGDTGDVIWDRTFENQAFGSLGYGQLRTINDTVLAVLTPEGEESSTLRAFEASSGETRWETPAGGDRTRLVATDELAIIGKRTGVDGEVEAYDIDTGSIEWFTPVPGISGTSGSDPIVEHNGLLYHRRDDPPGQRIWAVDISAEDVAFDIGVMGNLTTRQTLTESADLDVTTEFLGSQLLIPAVSETLTAVDTNGDETWSVETGSQVRSVDRSAERDVTVGLTRGGSVFAFDEGTEEELWTSDPPGISIAGRFNPFREQMVVARGDFVVVGTDVPRETGHITVYDLETGDQRWATELSNPTAPTIVGDVLVVGDAINRFNSRVLAYDLASGSRLWDTDLAEEFDLGDISSITGESGQVEVTADDSGDYSVVAFDLTTGTVNWTEPLENVSDVSSVSRDSDRLIIEEDDGFDLRLISISTAGTTEWEEEIERSDGGSGIIGERYGLVSDSDFQTLDVTDGTEASSRTLEIDDAGSLFAGSENHYIVDEPVETIEIFDATAERPLDPVTVDEISDVVTVAGNRLYGTTDGGELIVYEDQSADESEPPGTDPEPDVATTITLTNVGSTAWQVTAIDGDDATSDLDVDDPSIELEVGARYEIRNDGWSAHPLALRDAEGTTLLSQAGDGRFEDNNEVAWTDDGDVIAFTFTDELADRLDTYICTAHASMIGAIGTLDDTGDADPEDPVAEYADEDGFIQITGVLDAVDDYSNGEIDIGVMLEVVGTYGSGDPVQ